VIVPNQDPVAGEDHGRIGSPVWWFRIALALLLALAILFVAYAATTPESTMKREGEQTRHAIEKDD